MSGIVKNSSQTVRANNYSPVQGKRIMTQEQRDRIWYIKEFKSNECACGETKRPRSSFCHACFKALPSTYQHALYQKMGDGYEEAYENAIQWLKDRL